MFQDWPLKTAETRLHIQSALRRDLRAEALAEVVAALRVQRRNENLLAALVACCAFVGAALGFAIAAAHQSGWL